MRLLINGGWNWGLCRQSGGGSGPGRRHWLFLPNLVSFLLSAALSGPQGLLSTCSRPLGLAHTLPCACLCPGAQLTPQRPCPSLSLMARGGRDALPPSRTQLPGSPAVRSLDIPYPLLSWALCSLWLGHPPTLILNSFLSSMGSRLTVAHTPVVASKVTGYCLDMGFRNLTHPLPCLPTRLTSAS